MAIFKSKKNDKTVNKTINDDSNYSSLGNKLTQQLGLINTEFQADVPIDVRVNAPTISTNTTTTDARQITNTYSPQISVISESPNSTLSTKKSDNVSPSNTPSVTASPEVTGSNVPVDIPVSISPNLSGGSNLLLILGIGAGAYFLLKGGKKK